jgi:hypothetical protein
MGTKTLISRILAASFVSLGISSISGISAPAYAQTPQKQCIYNNAGFSAKVEWYKPSSVTLPPGQKVSLAQVKVSSPIKVDNNVTLGVSSCQYGNGDIAIVRIIGFKPLNTVVNAAIGTGIALLAIGGGALICTNPVGAAACMAGVAAVGVVAGGGSSAGLSALPDVEEIAYIGVPGTKNYIDLSGTAWNVGIANTRSLSSPQGFEVLSQWFTGGEPGPRSITFFNQAGYVAKMNVTYFQRNSSGVDKPVTLTTNDISVGRKVHINIPTAISPKQVNVQMIGVGTFKNNFFSTTVPANFLGNKCFKAYGTIFEPVGTFC